MFRISMVEPIKLANLILHLQIMYFRQLYIQKARSLAST